MTVFGYLYDFIFTFFCLVLVSIKKIYQPLKAVVDHISKHLKVRQKYSAARRIFNSRLGVWKCSQTRTGLSFLIYYFISENDKLTKTTLKVV